MAAAHPITNTKRQLILFTTDTPLVVEAATLLGWIHHTAEHHAPQISVALETAAIPVDYHQPFTEAASIAAQIRQQCDAAAAAATAASGTAPLLTAAFCPTPAVAYHLLVDESEGAPLAALVVINAQEALPPSPQSVVAATPVKPGGKKAPEAKKAPPPKVAAKNAATAATEVNDDDAEERDAFAVELAILCEGDDPSDDDGADAAAAAGAASEHDHHSQRAPSTTHLHGRLEPNVEKQALFSVMDLAVVSVPHSTAWASQLSERIVPCMTNAVAAAAQSRQQCDRRVVKPFSTHRATATAAAAASSHPRGPWGLYHRLSAEEAWSATTGSVPRSSAQQQPLLIGGRRPVVTVPMSFRGSSPPRPVSDQLGPTLGSAGSGANGSSGGVAPSTGKALKAAPSRSAHSVAAAATLMAPGGNAAAYAARVASLIVEQTEKECVADAPVRHVIRVEKRHVPRESLVTPAAAGDAAGDSGTAAGTAATAVAAEASTEMATSSDAQRSSEFVAIHVQVGGLFEVPAQPASTEVSTFDDVWAVVKATCGWGGALSLPSAEPTAASTTAAAALGASDAGAAAERPSTRRTTAFVDGGSGGGGEPRSEDLIPPRPPASRGGGAGGASASAQRAPSPSDGDRSRLVTPGGGSRGAVSAAPTAAVAAALASAFGRDAVETRLLAARAVRRWDDAALAETKAVARDPRGEKAEERLVRDAQLHLLGGDRALSSTAPSPGATLTFRPDTTGGMSVASRLHEAEDAAELRRAAHETVTIAETKFALLQARAQAVVDRIARAAAAAAVADAPAMAENLGFGGTVTRKSEAALGTQVAFRSTSPTRPATSAPQPPPCVAAIASASIDTTAYAFTQPVQHADVLRVVADLEAPVAGQYVSEWVALDAGAIQRTVQSSLSQLANASSSSGFRDDAVVLTPLVAPVRPSAAAVASGSGDGGGFESRPSSSGSVLRSSAEVASYRAPLPVGLVCAARAVPPSGVRATNTTVLLGSPLTAPAYQLMSREVVTDSTQLATPLNKFCTRWLQQHDREVYSSAGPLLQSHHGASSAHRAAGSAHPPHAAITEDSATWFLADSSVVTAHSNSAHAERRVSVTVADIVASLNVVPPVVTADAATSSSVGRAKTSAVSTFPDGAALRIGYAATDGAEASSAAAAADDATMVAHYTTRGGHVVGFAPFKESTPVSISRTAGLPSVVAVLDPVLKTECRRHVQELRRRIDRQTGRVQRFLSDGVTQVLDPSTGDVCSYLHVGDMVSYLLVRQDGSRVARVWTKGHAAASDTVKLPPIDVSRAHDTESKSDIWSRADGTTGVKRPDGCSITVFPDGTRVVINNGMGGGDSRASAAILPAVQVESPAGPEAPPVPTVVVGSDGLLSLLSGDSLDTLVEWINVFGRDELLLSRRTGTTVAVDIATHVVLVAPWTLPSCLGATDALATLQSVPKKELLAALVGVHVFDLFSGGYRCLDLDFNELAIGLNAKPITPKHCGTGLVKPLESLHVGITPSPVGFLEYASVTPVDVETLLLKIAGQKKVVPPRASPKGLDAAGSHPGSRATTRQSQRTGSPGSERSAASSSFTKLHEASCEARIRTICNPVVAHFDLLAYNNVKQREAARRADAKSGQTALSSIRTPGCRPVLFAFYDDGSVTRLLTAADIAPLVRHALGTSAVTLARSVVGGEPGVQQITYLLDAAKPAAANTNGVSAASVNNKTSSNFVRSTKSAVLQSQAADSSDAPPPESLCSSAGSANMVLPSGLQLFDTVALIPRGLLPPAHVTAQFEAAIIDANPTLAINLTRYAPIAPLIRQAIIQEAVAAMNAKHSAELYSAALLVPDYRPAEERDANERLAEKHAYKIAQLKAARQAQAMAADQHAQQQEQLDQTTTEDAEPTAVQKHGSTARGRHFASTAEATLPVVVTPAKLQIGTVPRGYKYQVFLTIENTSTTAVTVTIKRAAALLPVGVNRHPVEVQSGRGSVPPQSSIRIGIVLTASSIDAASIRCNLVVETSASRSSILVPFSANLVTDETVAAGGDVAKVADKLPTSVKVIGVAA